MAKKDVPAIVSAMGLVSAFTVDLTKEVRAVSGSDHDIYRALSDQNLVRDFARKIVDYDTLSVHLEIYGDPNGSPSIERLIEMGQYERVDDDVTAEHFPLPKRWEIQSDLYLVRLRTHLDGEEALGRLDQRGYRPAGIGELLELGQSNPDMGKTFDIVALGSRWNKEGWERVPFISEFAGMRRLCCHMSLKGSYWTPDVRFLTIQK